MLHRIRYGTRPDGVVVPDRAVYHKVPGKGGTPPDSSSAATSPPSRCAPPTPFSFLYPPTASADSALTATAAPQADWTTPAFHARASRFATAIATPRRWHRGHEPSAELAAAPLPRPGFHGTRPNTPPPPPR